MENTYGPEPGGPRYGDDLIEPVGDPLVDAVPVLPIEPIRPGSLVMLPAGTDLHILTESTGPE